jgi:hypothetical protein
MRIGADDSIISVIFGSLLNVAVNDQINQSSGAVAQTITQGKNHLTINTAISIHHIRNHFLYFLLIVDNTSALIIALSILDITSNKQSQKTTTTIEIQSIDLI